MHSMLITRFLQVFRCQIYLHFLPIWIAKDSRRSFLRTLQRFTLMQKNFLLRKLCSRYYSHVTTFRFIFDFSRQTEEMRICYRLSVYTFSL